MHDNISSPSKNHMNRRLVFNLSWVVYAQNSTVVFHLWHLWERRQNTCVNINMRCQAKFEQGAPQCLNKVCARLVCARSTARFPKSSRKAWPPYLRSWPKVWCRKKPRSTCCTASLSLKAGNGLHLHTLGCFSSAKVHYTDYKGFFKALLEIYIMQTCIFVIFSLAICNR